MGETGTSGPSWTDELANIDRAANPAQWVAMLREMWSGDAEKEARYAQLFQRLDLRPGDRVLDVGCGAGGAMRLLARLTDGRNPIVGVDPSRLAIDAAVRPAGESPDGERPSALRYVVMDGQALGFAEGSFAAAYCSRVLIHAPDASRVVGEMVRVLRPGGRLMAVEPDRGASLLAVPHDEVHRAYWAHKRSSNPYVGRHLYGLLRQAGLQDVVVEVTARVSTQPPGQSHLADLERQVAERRGEYWDLVEAGIVAEDALRAYVDGLRTAVAEGTYLRCDVEFCAFATKPS